MGAKAPTADLRALALAAIKPGSGRHERTAAFHAAASPDAILALLENEDTLRGMVSTQAKQVLAVAAERDGLRAALTALWPVILKHIPQKALVAMSRDELNVFEQARAALAAADSPNAGFYDHPDLPGNDR